MEKIKINNNDILIQIARKLNVSITSILNGITQEQADLVEDLEISEDDIDLIEYFKNLKSLNIIGKKVPQIYKEISILDFPKLEELNVLATKGVTNINLSNLPQLSCVNISGNKNLRKIIGMENLTNLSQLRMRGNALEEVFDIKDIAEKTQADMNLELSMLHLIRERYLDFEQISNNSNLAKLICWSEQVDCGKILKLYYGNGIQIESKADEIISQIIDDSMSDIEKICAINTWFIENVKYDDGVYDERDEVREGKKKLTVLGLRNNSMANTSYNALINECAVCEGYTNAMKYLLNKVGIEAETVECKMGKTSGEENDFVKMSEADHSIIRFKTKDGWFYSDPTLDATRFKELKMKKLEGTKYFFKTKKEMLGIHSLVITEKEVESPEVRLQEYSNERLSEILTNQRDGMRESKQPVKQEKYREQVEEKTRTENNPESFRSHMKFDIPLEMQQEIIEIHNAVEANFAKEMEENPDKKKTEQTENRVW